MATLAKSAVSLLGTLPTSLNNQFHVRKEEFVCRRLKLVLTGQGGQTNTITANALGFETLVDCSLMWDAQNSHGWIAVVDPITNIILLMDPAGISTPGDFSSTAAYITVYGTLQTKPSLT